MVPGADGDPFVIQYRAEVVGMHARERERHDRRLIARSADEVQAGYTRQPLVGVLQQRMLCSGYYRHRS